MQQNPYAPPAHGPPHQPTAALQPPLHVSTIDSIRFAFSSNVGFGSLALGLLLMIIPIIGPILLAGWMAETHRRLVRRESPSVRGFEFSEFTSYLMGGLVPFAAQMAASFVVVIPMMFFMGIGAAIMVPAFANGPGPGGVTLALLLGGFGILMFVVMAGMIVLITALNIRAELTGNFPKTFDPPGVGRMMKRQWQSILGHSLLLALISIPLLFAGLLVFFIGIYLVAVALQFAQLHLRWQIYEADVRAGGETLPVFPGNGADL